jgi:hypothetical protein
MFRKYLITLFFTTLIFNVIFLISKYSSFVSNYKPKFLYNFFGFNQTIANYFILNISTFIIRKNHENCVYEISNGSGKLNSKQTKFNL